MGFFTILFLNRTIDSVINNTENHTLFRSIS